MTKAIGVNFTTLSNSICSCLLFTDPKLTMGVSTEVQTLVDVDSAFGYKNRFGEVWGYKQVGFNILKPGEDLTAFTGMLSKEIHWENLFIMSKDLMMPFSTKKDIWSESW